MNGRIHEERFKVRQKPRVSVRHPTLNPHFLIQNMRQYFTPHDHKPKPKPKPQTRSSNPTHQPTQPPTHPPTLHSPASIPSTQTHTHPHPQHPSIRPHPSAHTTPPHLRGLRRVIAVKHLAGRVRHVCAADEKGTRMSTVGQFSSVRGAGNNINEYGARGENYR